MKDVSDLSALYGETTDFTSVSGVQWQLFYSDENNIYLIANSFVPGETLPNELITDGQYTTYCRSFANYSNSTYTGIIMETEPWSNGAESATILENEQTNTYLKWVNSTRATIKNRPNMKAVAYMMDISKWSNFAGSINGAYAIGGPTLEMFVLSYNSKHRTNQLGTYGTSASDITSNNANGYGYYVKKENGSWTNYVTNLESNSDNMWVITSYDKAYGYWIASPSSTNENSVRIMYGDDDDGGCLEGNTPGYRYVGFRPLVTIPKSSLK